MVDEIQMNSNYIALEFIANAWTCFLRPLIQHRFKFLNSYTAAYETQQVVVILLTSKFVVGGIRISKSKTRTREKHAL